MMLRMHAPPPARGLPPAAPLTLAPALPHLPGTVRHVPDLVGAVLSASAVAAGVLAVWRGGAWGRLSPVGFGATGTEVVPDRAIGVTGATVLIGRPFGKRPMPAHAFVPVAVPMAALLAATALVRVAGVASRETERRSQGAAEEEPADFRRLLAGPRHAGAAKARRTARDSRVVNPL